MSLLNNSCRTEVDVELVISGDEFELNGVSEILKITPSEQWNKGDKVINKPIFRKDTTWSIGVGVQESFNIEEQAFKLLELIGNKTDELNKIRMEFNVELLILYTIYVRNDEAPVISFGNGILRFANLIGARIDVDLYNY